MYRLKMQSFIFNPVKKVKKTCFEFYSSYKLVLHNKIYINLDIFQFMH